MTHCFPMEVYEKTRLPISENLVDFQNGKRNMTL